MDSGAAEVVAPPEFAQLYHLKSSPGSGLGAKYRTPIRKLISNQGGINKEGNPRTGPGDLRTMTFRTPNVTQPLALARVITSRGHRIVLHDDNTYILPKATGKHSPLHKKGSVLVKCAQVVPPNDNQNSETDNAMWVGVTRQEE